MSKRGQSWRRGTKCDYKSNWFGFDPHLRRWIYLNLYFRSSLWCFGKARHWVPPFNTQCVHNSAEGGKRSVLTLGSLCLPYCVCNQHEADLIWFLNAKKPLQIYRKHNLFTHFRYISQGMRNSVIIQHIQLTKVNMTQSAFRTSVYRAGNKGRSSRI